MAWLAPLVCGLLTACQTVPRLPPPDTAEPGWKILQGQAVWHPRPDAPELAGELTIALHRNGRAWLEFTKTPMPFVVAQTTSNAWQIEFVPRKLTFSGRGEPPARFLWLHLPALLQGEKPPDAIKFEKTSGDSWRLANPKTGETLEGYLSP